MKADKTGSKGEHKLIAESVCEHGVFPKMGIMGGHEKEVSPRTGIFGGHENEVSQDGHPGRA